MARRGAVIEEIDDEEFDDETDLPLPSLPNTGSRGALLQELDDSPVWPPPTSPRSRVQDHAQGVPSPSRETMTVDSTTGRKTVWIEDGSAYKMWTSLYPIYFDAKRPYGRSERRIAREKSVWWPLSPDIVDACSQLGLRTLHEPTKRHPRDWENPGRVKVSFKVDGRLQNPSIKTKKQLLEAIALLMQKAHPDLIPVPETAGNPEQSLAPTSQPVNAPTNTSTNKKEKAKPENVVRVAAPAPRKSRLPQPTSCPPRLSQFSPAQEANILIETVRAGMNAPSGDGSPGGAGPGGGKGKRKIIRMRG